MSSLLLRSKVLLINVLLLVFSWFLEATPPQLTPAQTCKKTEEILRAHAIHKKITFELGRRTLENFLDELDPTKMYFIENEIVKWLHPSKELLSQLMGDYKKKKFVVFEEIYEVMARAIDRRHRLEKAASASLEKGTPSNFKEKEWAKDENALKERLLRIRALQLEVTEKLNLESKEQFLQRFVKYHMNRERQILQSNQTDRQKQLLAYFLKAFTRALDNHTCYFTPSEAGRFIIEVQQRLFGIGAVLRDDLNGFTLMRLIEGGPALRSGKLEVGDRIIAVNHEPVMGMDIIDVVELIRGPQGTTVSVTILREEKKEGEHKRFEVEVVRDEIVLEKTRFKTKTMAYGDGVIAHVRLFSFYQDPHHSSASDIKKVLEEIQKKEKLYGVILDLRGNAGGILAQAVKVTGLFIEKGIVVSTKDSYGTLCHLRNFDAELAWGGALIILTSKTSASAAEIVAQALQDYGRGIVVGDEHTWGKGSYQIFTQKSGAANSINPEGEYKVTRGLYYTVSGKSPQLTGVKVDIAVPGFLSDIEIGESFSQFPLKNDEIAPNFIDHLVDVHPFHRGKMMRLYKKNQQEKVTLYRKHLETLRNNSKTRIVQNKNYQQFLKEISEEKRESEEIGGYGQNDLQLEETYQIMKDLIFLLKNSS